MTKQHRCHEWVNAGYQKRCCVKVLGHEGKHRAYRIYSKDEWRDHEAR